MSIVCNCDPWYITMIQEIPSVVIVGILGVGGVIAYKLKDRIINFFIIEYRIEILSKQLMFNKKDIKNRWQKSVEVY